MISFLRGKIIHKSAQAAILDVNGVGYEILVNESFNQRLSLDRETELYIFEQTTEKGTFLYGLKNWQELQLFKLLNTVSGVGPKSALSLLNRSAEKIEQAIARADIGFLSSVPRLGRKTAERIVVELKKKVSAGSTPYVVGAAGYQDVVSALIALGYSSREAENAVSDFSFQSNDTKGRVKELLKALARK